ncbi:MAG: Ni/Fe hydrogenase subunit alpha, partial [Gammaproteobacteria bacterium]|nr:Ni/Fe hydrogenase subunit alpha [Gammaproteobacteria bacterium]
MTRSKKFKVKYLARVEGEGALSIAIHNNKVVEADLTIFEPPRFFEAFLKGRSFEEVPDITARICGICPVAYQMSAVHAIEDALGMTVSEPVRMLRRLLYCGEWIESHGLHIYMLHAPDFLGYESVMEMAKDHSDAVQKGLLLKQAGNSLVALLGGREVHPINVRVGGFYRMPTRKELMSLLDEFERARDVAIETVMWTGGFDFPECDRDYEYVSVVAENDYPFCEGRIKSSKGLDISAHDFDDHIEEIHVKRSNALHARIKTRGNYHCGPMARYNLNYDQLSPVARHAATQAGLEATCNNPFKSIVVRAVEVLNACNEAIDIIKNFQEPESSQVAYPDTGGSGHAATEAPRGLLYHHYRINEDGTIAQARIVPPTSQNQAVIEE